MKRKIIAGALSLALMLPALFSLSGCGAAQARNVEMMYGSEDRYLDDGKATGFIKYYADQKYAFATLRREFPFCY